MTSPKNKVRTLQRARKIQEIEETVFCDSQPVNEKKNYNYYYYVIPWSVFSEAEYHLKLKIKLYLGRKKNGVSDRETEKILVGGGVLNKIANKKQIFVSNFASNEGPQVEI